MSLKSLASVKVARFKVKVPETPLTTQILLFLLFDEFVFFFEYHSSGCSQEPKTEFLLEFDPTPT